MRLELSLGLLSRRNSMVSASDIRSPGPFAHPAMLCAASTVVIAVYAGMLHGLGILADGGLLTLMSVLLAATVASIGGFAFSAIGAALLLPQLQEPVQVVTVLLLSSIAIQSLSVWLLRVSIDWRALMPFLIGGLSGLPLGVYLLLNTAPADYVQLMGAALVLYGAFMLFRRPFTVRSGPIRDAVVGALGGLTRGLAALPGAFVTIWCGMKEWDKAHQRGVYQPFILTMQVCALLFIQIVSPTASTELGATAVTFVPAALLGTSCGLAIFKRLTDAQFATAINVLLIASGLGLAL